MKTVHVNIVFIREEAKPGQRHSLVYIFSIRNSTSSNFINFTAANQANVGHNKILAHVYVVTIGALPTKTSTYMELKLGVFYKITLKLKK